MPRKELRNEQLYIYYDKNFMGWNGPRKMRVFQPKFNPKRAQFLAIKPTVKEETIELLSSKFNKIVGKDPKMMKKIGKCGSRVMEVNRDRTKRILHSVSKRSKESRISKLFKEDEDLQMIKQNLDFSDSSQMVELMEKVLSEHSNVLNQHEIKVIKKQLKWPTRASNL